MEENSKLCMDTKGELRQAIIARRQARGDSAIKLEYREPQKMELTPAEKEKKERRKEQNRRAAQRCRSKKRLTQSQVLQNYEQIVQNNENLKSEMKALKREHEHLIKTWHKHKAICPVLHDIPCDLNAVIKKEPGIDDANMICGQELQFIPLPDSTMNNVFDKSDVNSSGTPTSSTASHSLPARFAAFQSKTETRMGQHTNETDNKHFISSASREINFDVPTQWANRKCRSNTIQTNKVLTTADSSTHAQFPNFPASHFQNQNQCSRERSRTYPVFDAHSNACVQPLETYDSIQSHQFPDNVIAQQQARHPFVAAIGLQYNQPQSPYILNPPHSFGTAQQLRHQQPHQQQHHLKQQPMHLLHTQQQNKQQHHANQSLHQQLVHGSPIPQVSPNIARSMSVDPSDKYPDIRRLLQSPIQAVPSPSTSVHSTDSDNSKNDTQYNKPIPSTSEQLTPATSSVRNVSNAPPTSIVTAIETPSPSAYLLSDINTFNNRSPTSTNDFSNKPMHIPFNRDYQEKRGPTVMMPNVREENSRNRSQSGDGSFPVSSCRYEGRNRSSVSSIFCQMSPEVPMRCVDGVRMSSVSTDASPPREADESVADLPMEDADDVFPSIQTIPELQVQDCEQSPLSCTPYDFIGTTNDPFDSPANEDRRNYGSGRNANNMSGDQESSMTERNAFPMSDGNGENALSHDDVIENENFCTPTLNGIDDPILQDIPNRDLLFFFVESDTNLCQ